MSPYRRGKRKDSQKPQKKELSVNIGSVRESFESLQALCNDKANEIIKSVDLEKGEEMQVVFWTEDYPEVIGAARIVKTEGGLMTYSMDYSLSTL